LKRNIVNQKHFNLAQQLIVLLEKHQWIYGKNMLLTIDIA